jgi:NAD(P)H-dependent FMN reductase
VASNAWAPSQNPVAQRWQKKVAEFDGYIFVTAEYNHGIPAALKNALDYAYPEWVKKAAGFVGYGSVGGARAIEQLRLVAAELQMATIRNGVYIQGADFSGMEGRQGLEGHRPLGAGVKDVLDQLVWWTRALKTARPTSWPRPRTTSIETARINEVHHVHSSVKKIIQSKPTMESAGVRLRAFGFGDARSSTRSCCWTISATTVGEYKAGFPGIASRHRDDHLCPGRRGGARRQSGQSRLNGRQRRAMDDGRQRHQHQEMPKVAQGRMRLPALGQSAGR